MIRSKYRRLSLGLGLLALVAASCPDDDTANSPPAGGSGGLGGSSGAAGRGGSGAVPSTGGTAGAGATGGSGGSSGAGAAGTGGASGASGQGGAGTGGSSGEDGGGDASAGSDAGDGSVGSGGTGGGGGNGATGGADGSAATGGTGGAGATGGAGGGDAGRRVLLIPDSTLWVDGSTNDVGIQGAWYGFTHSPGPDAQPSTITLTPSAEGVCVNAHVHRVDDVNDDQVIDTTDYDVYWGVAFVLQFNNPGGASPGENVYNALAQGVEGFSFVLGGSTFPGELRVNYTTPVEYCKPFAAPGAGAYEVLISETRRQCYLQTPPAGAPDPSALYRIQFSIPSSPDWATTFVDFNFCIRNLRAELM